MPQVRMPDGTVVAFPDDMQPDQIKGIIATKFPEVAPKVDPATNQPPGVPAFSPPGVEGYDPQTGNVDNSYSRLGSAGMGAADAATLGFGDELASYPASWLTGVPRDEVLSSMRGDAQQAQQDNPGSYLAGQIGGGLAQAVGTGGAGFGTLAARSGAGLGKMALGGAIDGAAYGGAYGAGSADEGNRLSGAGFGAGAGFLLGGGLPVAAAGASALGRRAVTPFASSPERQAAVAALTREGVPLTAGQKTGSDWLRYRESELGGRHAAGLMEQQAEAFTDAAMRRAGASGRATSDNMAALSDRLGKGFDDLSARNELTVDGPFLQDVVGTLQEYNRVLPSEQKQILGSVASDIAERIKAGGGKMPGKDYQAIRSRLTKRAQNARGSDNELADAYRGIRNALDGNMERSINPADKGAWGDLRRQYGNMKVLERASTGAGEDAAMGLISPARLRMAASTGNRGGYARGQGDFADLAKAGQAVMSPLPNSGTAQRMAAHGLFSGLAAGGGSLIAGAPGLALGLAAPAVAGRTIMSKPVQRYLSNQAVSGGGNPVREAIIAAIMRGGALPAIEGR